MSRAAHVIVVGQTGLEKDHVAQKVRRWLEDTDHSLVNRVKVYDAEKSIAEAEGGDPRLLAGVKSGHSQRQSWRKGWIRLLKQCRTESNLCSIIHLHLVFAGPGRRICPASLHHLAELKPDVVVTLVDDIYAIKRRIQLKGFDFSFAQLYEWREIEMMLADQLALLASLKHHPSGVAGEGEPKAECDSIMLACKHPTVTLGRLLLNRAHPRAYLSFPISSTRGSKKRRDEINVFRARAHKLLIAFDPLSIEELPLIYHRGKQAIGRKRFHPERGDDGKLLPLADRRWDCRLCANGESAPMLWEPEQYKNDAGRMEAFYPVRFRSRELNELWRNEGGEHACVVVDHLSRNAE